jgi:restriction system protein
MAWWRKPFDGEARGAASAVPDMRWPEFALLVGEGFRLQGYLVIETGGAGLVLEKGKDKFLVDCSHWRAAKVDAGPVRELQSFVAAKGLAGAFALTAGEFTAAAVEIARACGIHLVNGAKLSLMLEKARLTVTRPFRIEPHLAASPACPNCSRMMLKRTAGRGVHAGKPLWVCPAFPDCRGTLPA